MKELIECQCQLAAGIHKKCVDCGAHMPVGVKVCDAIDCERIAAEREIRDAKAFIGWLK